MVIYNAKQSYRQGVNTRRSGHVRASQVQVLLLICIMSLGESRHLWVSEVGLQRIQAPSSKSGKGEVWLYLEHLGVLLASDR